MARPLRRLGTATLLTLFVVILIRGAAGAQEIAEVRWIQVADHSVQLADGWLPVEAAPDESRLFSAIAEPLLQRLLGTPPPVLLSVRDMTAAEAAAGGARAIAASLIVGGLAEDAILGLRRITEADRLSVPPRFVVDTIVSMRSAWIDKRPATRFELALRQRDVVFGIAFPQVDRTDAIAVIAFVAPLSEADRFRREIDAMLDSLRFGVPEIDADLSEGATTLQAIAETIRTLLWGSVRDQDPLTWARRLVVMAVIFCLIFAATLRLAGHAVQRLRQSRGGTDRGDEELLPVRSQLFLLPIAFFSISVTALIVMWLMGL